jgi:hypothetical protein
MPRKLINPDELFSLLFNAPEGLTPSEVEFALGLTPNTVDYHLKKKAFSKQISGRYKLTSRDLDDFRTLGGYALPVANEVVKKNYPFKLRDWKSLVKPSTLSEVMDFIKLGAEELLKASNYTDENNLSGILMLTEMLQYYVDSIAFDKRYSDPEAREYILTTPLEK